MCSQSQAGVGLIDLFVLVHDPKNGCFWWPIKNVIPSSSVYTQPSKLKRGYTLWWNTSVAVTWWCISNGNSFLKNEQGKRRGVGQRKSRLTVNLGCLGFMHRKCCWPWSISISMGLSTGISNWTTSCCAWTVISSWWTMDFARKTCLTTIPPTHSAGPLNSLPPRYFWNSAITVLWTGGHSACWSMKCFLVR